MGLECIMARVLANSTSDQMANDVARGSSLESVSVREREKKYLGDSAGRSLRKYRIAFWRVLRIIFRRWGFAHKISASEKKIGAFAWGESCNLLPCENVVFPKGGEFSVNAVDACVWLDGCRAAVCVGGDVAGDDGGIE